LFTDGEGKYSIVLLVACSIMIPVGSSSSSSCLYGKPNQP